MMDNQDTHLTFEELTDYVDGRLLASELERVEAHLDGGCEACQREVGWLRETTAVMAESWEAPSRAVRANVQRAFRHYVPANGEAEKAAAPVPFFHRLFKSNLRWVTAVAAVLVLFLISGSYYRSWAEEIVINSAGVIELSGTVEVNRAGTWQEVSLNNRFSPGDVIRTGEDGELGVKFFDNNVTYLAPNTQIEIVAFSVRRDGQERIITLRQLSGQLFSSGWPPDSDLTYFVISSPQSVVTIQASGYDFMVDAGGNSEVSVIDGCAEIVSYDVSAKVGHRQQTGSTCSRQPQEPENPQPIIPIQEL